MTNEGPPARRLVLFEYRLHEWCQRCRTTPCISTPSTGKPRPARPPRGDAANLNLDGRLNYVYMETRGRGHLMGVTLGVLQNADGWWGEGDDMIFIDDETKPAINGTGSEDYFLGSWDFGGRDGAEPFAHSMYGAPLIVERRTHRRPLLLLPLARRQSGDLRALPETHHGARPRQRPRRQLLLRRLLVSVGAVHGFSAAAPGGRAHPPGEDAVIRV